MIYKQTKIYKNIQKAEIYYKRKCEDSRGAENA